MAAMTYAAVAAAAVASALVLNFVDNIFSSLRWLTAANAGSAPEALEMDAFERAVLAN